jgi:pimeloyl-ACP methyl ester carboxylesterase
MQSFWIRTPAVDFHARMQGTAPRAVFVHGLGGDLSTWDSVWDALGHDYPALRYDLRGHGDTVCRVPGPYTHPKDLRSILDAANIAKCDLIGVSMGGGIVLNFALDHPDRVRNLVLISPQIVGWEFSEAWQAQWQPILDAARGGDLARAKQLFWEHPLFETTRHSPAAEQLRASIMRFSGEHWLGDEHELMYPDVERLHQLTTRTLLLTGGRDLDDLRVMAELIAGSAPNVQRIDVPELGHLLHMEDPRRCATWIREFLR